MLKRAFDVLSSALALLLVLPLFALVALAIKLDSPGPVFYLQERVGWRGRTFRIFKFRSMVRDADLGGPALTTQGDARVTRVGRIIRALRIDELPQMINVLRGDMSLVGPRPEVPSIVAQYPTDFRQILEVRPGLTGPTQLAWLDESSQYPAGVDPTRHYLEHILPAKLQSDLRYARTRSFGGDLRCLLQTPLVVAGTTLSKRTARTQQGVRLGLDVLAVAAANCAAFVAAFNASIPSHELRYLVYGLPLACLCYGASFLMFATYRSIWRYASVEDLWSVVRACAVGGAIHAFCLFLLGWRPYSRSVLMLTPMLSILLTGGIRFAVRWHAPPSRSPGSSRTRRIVIAGAGPTGESIVREIRRDRLSGCKVIGFVDDDPRKRGETIHNVPVLGTIDDLPHLARLFDLSDVIIAIPTLSGREMRRIAEVCAHAELDFRSVPSLGQLVRGEGRLRYLRDVNPADLLRRPPVSLDDAKIAGLVRGRRAMVTGAGGSIGSELCRQLLALGVESLIMVERSETPLHDLTLELRRRDPQAKLVPVLADVKHTPRISDVIGRLRPHVVFHAAAYKHVPLLEGHPVEAVLNNVVATRRLARIAAEHGVHTFVLISTDKAVCPNSVMGATKKICEMYVGALGAAARRQAKEGLLTRFVAVRFGNVLGSAGSVLPIFQSQIDAGGPLTITDPEVTRFFMTIPEAASLVLQSAASENEGTLFLLDMGDSVKISVLADDLVSALGLSPGDVPRRYVGLRPGEKMEEILVETDEEILRSSHDHIFVVRHRIRPIEEMELLVDELEHLALEGDVEKLLLRVREQVPSYRPAVASSVSARADATPRGAARTPSEEPPARTARG